MCIEVIEYFTQLETVDADWTYKMYRSTTKIKAQYMWQCRDVD